MVDWNGLYKWSMQYQDDGTAPSQFKPMSAEDRKWLEDAMKHYSLNDTDRLTECINKLKEWSMTAAAESQAPVDVNVAADV